VRCEIKTWYDIAKKEGTGYEGTNLLLGGGKSSQTTPAGRLSKISKGSFKRREKGRSASVVFGHRFVWGPNGAPAAAP